MSGHGIKNPEPTKSVKVLRRALSPYTFGILGSAVAIRTLPSLHERWGVLPPVFTSEDVGFKHISKTLGTVVIGYTAGLGLRQFLSWIRLRVIKNLLAYHGWLFKPNSNSTKVSIPT